MKLGEALNQRKYYMNHIPQLLSKLQGCITVAQGAIPNRAEPSAADLKAALDTEMSALNELIININRTNNAARLPCGLSVMEGIAQREYLKQAQATYAGIAAHIRPRVEKDYRDQERTTYVVAEGIHPANIRQMTDEFSKRWRILDNELQQANWTIDLIGA